MANADQPSPANPARQCRQYVDSLRAAGVEWLPKAPPLPLAPPQSPSEPSVKTAPLPESAVVTPATPQTALWPTEVSAKETVPLEQRRQALQILAERVSRCTRCAALASTRTQTVFGVGRLDTDLCFIGEAPGADEDRQGEPFVGAAGQLLNRIIEACGMKREDVYICNILRCRPPGNRLPLPNEAANCREYLERQIELVRPKFICALGACAAQNLLTTTLSIGRLRGRFHDYQGIPVLCTYHPAYLLRNPEKKRDVWEDMKTLLTRMGRPIPAKG